MTIGERLKRIEYGLGYGTVAVTLAIFFAWHSRHPDVSKDQAIRQILWIFLPLGVAMSIVLNRVYRCPRCHASFGKLKREQVRWGPDRYRLLGVGQIQKACPQCHVSFDEPWT
jgi:uncharacterized protein with PIN domain